MAKPIVIEYLPPGPDQVPRVRQVRRHTVRTEREVYEFFQHLLDTYGDGNCPALVHWPV